jgi:hypothetical protein
MMWSLRGSTLRSAGPLLIGVLLAAILAGCGSGGQSQAPRASATVATRNVADTGNASGGADPARFPRAIYPASRKPSEPWGDPENCPSKARVQALPRQSPNRRIAALLGKFSGRPAHDRRYADRAFWPALRDNYIPHGVYRGKKAPPYKGRRLSATSNAKFVKNHCGREIERRSWSFVFTQTRRGHRERALESTFYLLQRQGHWLVWFLS